MKKALRASTAFSLAGLLAISPLIGPVTAVYAVSNVPSADAAVDVATADDDGVASRYAGSVDVDAAEDSSPATNVDELADEDFGVDVSENHQQAEPVDSSFNMYILPTRVFPAGLIKLSPLLLPMTATPLLPQCLTM